MTQGSQTPWRLAHAAHPRDGRGPTQREVVNLVRPEGAAISNGPCAVECLSHPPDEPHQQPAASPPGFRFRAAHVSSGDGRYRGGLRRWLAGRSTRRNTAAMAKRKPAPPRSPQPRHRAQNYTVLARRYRPQQFADLVGQEAVAQALANAISSGRVAHAYLFTGVRGVGKTSAARILAKALNCVNGPTATPCDAMRHLPGDRRPARTSTCSRSTAPATTASTKSANCAKTSSSARAGRASRSTSSTKSTCWPPAERVQRAAQDAGGAAAARQVHLRHDRGAKDPRRPSCRAASASTSAASARRASSSGCARSSRPKGCKPTTRRWNWSPAAPAARCATRSRCWISCSRSAANG